MFLTDEEIATLTRLDQELAALEVLPPWTRERRSRSEEECTWFWNTNNIRNKVADRRRVIVEAALKRSEEWRDYDAIKAHTTLTKDATGK